MAPTRTKDPVQLNLQAAEIRELEVLGDDWERLTFDCMACGAEGSLTVDVHFTDGRSDIMIPVTDECPKCGIEVETVAPDEV